MHLPAAMSSPQFDQVLMLNFETHTLQKDNEERVSKCIEKFSYSQKMELLMNIKAHHSTLLIAYKSCFVPSFKNALILESIVTKIVLFEYGDSTTPIHSKLSHLIGLMSYVSSIMDTVDDMIKDVDERNTKVHKLIKYNYFALIRHYMDYNIYLFAVFKKYIKTVLTCVDHADIKNKIQQPCNADHVYKQYQVMKIFFGQLILTLRQIQLGFDVPQTSMINLSKSISTCQLYIHRSKFDFVNHYQKYVEDLIKVDVDKPKVTVIGLISNPSIPDAPTTSLKDDSTEDIDKLLDSLLQGIEVPEVDINVEFLEVYEKLTRQNTGDNLLDHLFTPKRIKKQ